MLEQGLQNRSLLLAQLYPKPAIDPDSSPACGRFLAFEELTIKMSRDTDSDDEIRGTNHRS